MSGRRSKSSPTPRAVTSSSEHLADIAFDIDKGLTRSAHKPASEGMKPCDAGIYPLLSGVHPDGACAPSVR